MFGDGQSGRREKESKAGSGKGEEVQRGLARTLLRILFVGDVAEEEQEEKVEEEEEEEDDDDDDSFRRVATLPSVKRTNVCRAGQRNSRQLAVRSETFESIRLRLPSRRRPTPTSHPRDWHLISLRTLFSDINGFN